MSDRILRPGEAQQQRIRIDLSGLVEIMEQHQAETRQVLEKVIGTQVLLADTLEKLVELMEPQK